MANIENLFLTITLVTLGLALVFFLGSLLRKKALVRAVMQGNPAPLTQRIFTPTGYLWIVLIGLALVFVTVSLVSRMAVSGRGPFSNMYEFTVAFAWAVIVMSLAFMWRYRTVAIGVIGVIISLGLLVFANNLPSRIMPLVPALQQSVLLSIHVTCAVIAYGTLTVGFGSALLTLFTARRQVSWLPAPEILDRISHHTMIIGFPFLTLTIVLGAVWANIAWGSPWSWDPKETASLVTWLIFAAYLHTRVLQGWRGTRSAILLVIGFMAVLFTFFGNYIFTGLHSYG